MIQCYIFTPHDHDSLLSTFLQKNFNCNFAMASSKHLQPQVFQLSVDILRACTIYKSELISSSLIALAQSLITVLSCENSSHVNPLFIARFAASVKTVRP